MRIILFLSSLLASVGLHASELVYNPYNPSFGGFSANGSVLLNQANAQNTFKDPDAKDPFAEKSTLEKFKESLNRQILSQLASKIVTDAFGNSSSGSGSGIYTTTDFKIEIDTSNSSLTKINITDLATGDVTTIEIPVF